MSKSVVTRLTDGSGSVVRRIDIQRLEGLDTDEIKVIIPTDRRHLGKLVAILEDLEKPILRIDSNVEKMCDQLDCETHSLNCVDTGKFPNPTYQIKNDNRYLNGYPELHLKTITRMLKKDFWKIQGSGC